MVYVKNFNATSSGEQYNSYNGSGMDYIKTSICGSDMTTNHDADECLVVLTGKPEVHMEVEVVTLESTDNIYIKGTYYTDCIILLILKLYYDVSCLLTKNKQRYYYF